jgi:Methyltransferase domain
MRWKAMRCCSSPSMGPGAGAVVELGSYLGRSTCFLALGVKRGARPPVVAIDHFEDSPELQAGASHQSAAIEADGTTFHQFQRNLDRVGVTRAGAAGAFRVAGCSARVARADPPSLHRRGSFLRRFAG